MRRTLERQQLWVILLFAATCLLVYWPCLHGQFFFDDFNYLVDFTLVNGSGSLWDIWRGQQMPEYWPVTYSLFWIEWRLFGRDPFGYHLVNLMIHILNGVSFWFLMRQLNMKWAIWSVLIFLLHPVACESVAWIIQTKTTLSLLFCLLSANCYFLFEKSQFGKYLVAAYVFFALALLTKITVISLPLLLLGYLYVRDGRLTRISFVRISPFLLLCLLLGVVNLLMHSSRALDSSMLSTPSYWERVTDAGLAYWFYLKKAFLPVNMAVIYPDWSAETTWLIRFLPIFVSTVLMYELWWVRHKTWPKTLLYFLLAYAVCLLPVIGIIDAVYLRISPVADHYQYPALLVLSVFIVGVITKVIALKQRFLPWIAQGVIASILIAFAYLCFHQAQLYADPIRLWEQVIRVNSNAYIAYFNLARMHAEAGDHATAERNFRQTISIKSDHYKAMVGLGVVLGRKGQLNEAITWLRQAILVAPAYPEAHENLGVALLLKGDTNDALTAFNKAFDLNPSNAPLALRLVQVLLNSGKAQEAAIFWRKIQQAEALQSTQAFLQIQSLMNSNSP